MKLSIIIVNYNVSYFLSQTLLSVRRALEKLHAPAEVFVVDNNSVDGSVAMVRARFPEVILLENKHNPGFAKANNQAIRQAQGEYILLLNPDTVVEEDTFRLCCEFLGEHPEGGGLGVKMLDGQGKFLPESKRGLPTPRVAFYKVFGLAALFPGSRTFGRYHLGYLDKDQTHEVDVLSGAFMLLRKSALDAVGLLDEDYFMYGEDIDLSYRLTRGGWKNYYFPGTRIIHYKGESTKRTSVNYVFVFYRAMIVFARKHFAPNQAGVFSLLIHLAIWLRAGIAVGRRVLTSIVPIVLDAGLLYGGMYLLKNYWEEYQKQGPADYPSPLMEIVVPAYVLVWLGCAYLSGSYDKPFSTWRIIRGIVVGTVLISAGSNFLESYRYSNALILLGGIWSILALIGRRLISHVVRHRNLRLMQSHQKKIAIVGSAEESRRVRHLLETARVQARIVGHVTPVADPTAPPSRYLLGQLHQLDEIIRIHDLDELIFCGKDLSATRIISLMIRLPQYPPVAYKILPEDSEYIIGSSSKDAPGEYYALDIALNLFQPQRARTKRLLDVLTSLSLLLAAPLLVWFAREKAGYLRNCLRVLLGTRTWVGLRHADASRRTTPAVFSPADSADTTAAPLPEATRRRLELLYAKDYTPSTDLNILVRRFRWLGQE